MAQVSGPLSGENFPDDVWRSIFDTTPGIVGDRDGTAFGLTLPTSTNNAALGSVSQDSCAVVGGYLLRIDQGDTQTVSIPESSNSGNGRTDLIVARLDPATYTTEPGPVRLARIAGVEGSASAPSYNQSGSVVDLPLWAVTRKQGQSLNQAAAVDLRRHLGTVVDSPAGVALPGSAPLGTVATRDGIRYLRAMDGSAPAWVKEEWLPESGWHANYAPEGMTDGRRTVLGSSVRYYGVGIPAKPFSRSIMFEIFGYVDMVDGNSWRVDVQLVDAGTPNTLAAGESDTIASKMIENPSDGQGYSIDMTVGAIISASAEKVVRVWLRRIRGNDGLLIVDHAGYAFRASWSEISTGNDW